MPLVIDKSKSKKEDSLSDKFALVNLSSAECISYHLLSIFSESSRYVEVELNASTISA